jgi:mRNA-degrading endonuclease RelE of RelBE toxin-antitoxin system
MFPSEASFWRLPPYHKIRTADWRIIFRVVGEEVRIVRIAHRRDVYED